MKGADRGLRWRGVRAVAGLEVRARLRTGRWRWALALWATLLLGFVLAVRAALGRVGTGPGFGAGVFGLLVLFLVLLLLLVVPALGAQSVNGDRARGLLAPLQVTLLSPAEIALGKLLAVWTSAAALLGATLPAAAATVAMGGLPPHRVAAAFAILAVLAGVLAAVAQCLSALLARTTTSAVLAYLGVFGLTFGSWFGTVALENAGYADDTLDIGPGWLLNAADPFVLVADAVPRARPPMDPATGLPRFVPLVGYSPAPWDPLAFISMDARFLRDPDNEWFDFDPDGFYDDEPIDLGHRGHAPGPVWPYGLAPYVALAAGAVAVTVRRLRAPTGRLPAGTRVA